MRKRNKFGDKIIIQLCDHCCIASGRQQTKFHDFLVVNNMPAVYKYAMGAMHLSHSHRALLMIVLKKKPVQIKRIRNWQPLLFERIIELADY